MTHPFRTPDDYELFIYSLVDQYPQVKRSTLTFFRLGVTMAKVSGELFFNEGFRLTIRERLVFDRLPIILDSYSYEIWQDDEKLSWYDPQPHPNERQLIENFPHHKHTPPDIKHHRTTAIGMSFSNPNLPLIIEEVIRRLDK
jgi:hypothetical protein